MSLNPLIVEECLTNAMMALGDEIYPADLQGLSVNVDLENEHQAQFASASKVVESVMLYECVQNIVNGVENPSRFEKQIVREWLRSAISAYERYPVLRSCARESDSDMGRLIDSYKTGWNESDYGLVSELSRKFFRLDEAADYRLAELMDDPDCRLIHSVSFQRKDSYSFQICEGISGALGATKAALWDAPWESLDSVESFNDFLQDKLNNAENAAESLSPCV